MKIHFYDPYKRIVKDIEDDEIDNTLSQYLSAQQLQVLYNYANAHKTYVTEIGVQWMHIYIHLADNSIFQFC